MSVRVVDASALGALIFGEPEGPEMAVRLSGAELVAPSLLWFEVSSIALRKARAAPEFTGALLQSLHLARRMGIKVVEVDDHEVVTLALERDLTAYDAAYLWLFLRLGAEGLVTLDGDLGGAAEALS